MALVLDLLVVSFYFLYCLFQFAFQFLVGIALVLTPERRIPQPPADNRYKQRHRSNTLSCIAHPLSVAVHKTPISCANTLSKCMK
jgi:hypothetical protein